MGKSRIVLISAKEKWWLTPPTVLVFSAGLSGWPNAGYRTVAPGNRYQGLLQFCCPLIQVSVTSFFLVFLSPHQEEEKNEHNRLLAVQETRPRVWLNQRLPNQELQRCLQITSGTFCSTQSRGRLLVLKNVGNAQNAAMVGDDIWFVFSVNRKSG